MQVRSLGWGDPLEEGMATHSSILAWRIPWTGNWQATVHRVSKSQIQLKWLSTKHESTALRLMCTSLKGNSKFFCYSQTVFSCSQLIHPNLSNAFSTLQYMETNKNSLLSLNRSKSIHIQVWPQSNLQDPVLPHRLIRVAAAAKLLQLCPTLCNPIDGSPPGSPVPGMLQARTLSGLPFLSPMHEREKWKRSRSVMPDSQQP